MNDEWKALKGKALAAAAIASAEAALYVARRPLPYIPSRGEAERGPLERPVEMLPGERVLVSREAASPDLRQASGGLMAPDSDWWTAPAWVDDKQAWRHACIEVAAVDDERVLTSGEVP